MPTTFEADRPDDYLLRLARSRAGTTYKTVARDELDVRPGHAVVDLGCGPGADLAALREAAGPTGRVVGIDSDPGALAVAAGVAGVETRLGDIQRLDLAEASADRARTDRVLQHVSDVSAVLDGVRRVLRPGGRLVCAEPDWDTLVLDHDDREAFWAYRRFVVEQVVLNATIGRELPRLVDDAGFDGVRVLPVTTVMSDAAEADRILGFRRVTTRAVGAGYLDEDRAGAWLAGLSTGRFLASVTLFVTVAEAPPGG